MTTRCDDLANVLDADSVFLFGNMERQDITRQTQLARRMTTVLLEGALAAWLCHYATSEIRGIASSATARTSRTSAVC